MTHGSDSKNDVADGRNGGGELHRVIDALAEVIHKDAIGPWLEQPNEAFDGLKPIEVIERGEVDRIWEMVFFLRSGVAS